MKNIKYYIVALILTLSFSSCQDWLTIYPNNAQTSDQYWRNKEEVEAVLAAGYMKLRTTQPYMLTWGESRGEGIQILSVSSGSILSGCLDLERADILPENKLTSWAALYDVINMANSVIKYAPIVKDDSYNEFAMKSHLSEAYFLRALSYFYLVRTFRDVPYVTDPYVTDDQPYDKAKSTEAEILTALLLDLNNSKQYAKEHFPETDLLNPINTKGRATRWAIYALIADINLWMGNYQDCIYACDQIMTSGRVGLIQAPVIGGNAPNAVDKLNTWFTNYFPGNTNESIFEVQYSNKLSQPNKELYDWFTTTVTFNPTYSTQMLFAMNPSDIRSASIASGLLISKYRYSNAATLVTRSSTQNDQNWLVYRFAEIYLMKAEALIMKDGVNKDNYESAVALIQQIRTRANAGSVSTILDEELMLKLVLEERRLEFFAEGKNWFDLLRMAKRDEFKHKKILLDAITNRDQNSSGSSVVGRLADNNALYLPINSNELKNNKLLVQNPYYENLGK